MSLSAEQVRFCRSLAGEALLAAPLPADPLAAVTALRKMCDVDQAAAVMEVLDIRRRALAGDKFPTPWAGRLLGTDRLLQQASSIRLATYVGRRLAEAAGGEAVWDLCCGLGADALGLAASGATVRAFDRSEQALLCAEHNAAVANLSDRCTFTLADVTELDLPAEAVVHIDPDRRPDGRRSASLDDCVPGAEFLAALRRDTRAGAMKLSPALSADSIAAWPTVQTEYVSEGGVCRQLVGWWGIGRPHDRQATVVFGDMLAPESVSLVAGAAETAPVAEAGAWIVAPDPAVIAAGATDDLAALLTDGGAPAWRIAPGLDWLSADQPVDTPLARCFELLRTVPGRRRDVAAAVHDLGGGIVEVKPRGVKLDTDAMQKALRGDDDRPLTVLWCRIGPKQQAFIAQRR